MTPLQRALFWRIPGWAAITLATAFSVQGTQERVWAGVLMAVAGVAAQFTDDVHAVTRTSTAIVIATVAGLAAVLIAPRGLGEVPAFVVAGRIPFSIHTRTGRVFVATTTVVVAAVIGYVSHSLVGCLAGLGIPLLAQRAAERRELIASRDEAQALLLEVQAGRDAEAQAATLQERGRIARELHDVLAHSLAGLSVQLQATRAVAAREGVGPAVLEPLDHAAALARDGLGEARAVVGALRDPHGLGIADLRALVDRHPGAATLRVSGEPVEVPPAAGHAAYRAVQEALTNAARYAPGSPVAVTVDHAADGVTVCITDDGPPPGREPVPGQGTGLGLAGMSERLAGVGGSVTAGPRPSAGWQVRVHVPAQAPA